MLGHLEPDLVTFDDAHATGNDGARAVFVDLEHDRGALAYDVVAHVHDEIAPRVDLEPVGALELQADGGRVGTGGEGQVELEAIVGQVVDDIDAAVHTHLAHLGESLYAGDRAGGPQVVRHSGSWAHRLERGVASRPHRSDTEAAPGSEREHGAVGEHEEIMVALTPSEPHVRRPLAAVLLEPRGTERVGVEGARGGGRGRTERETEGEHAHLVEGSDADGSASLVPPADRRGQWAPNGRDVRAGRLPRVSRAARSRDQAAMMTSTVSTS